MRMTDLIAKKRDGQTLTTEEIYTMITGFTNGNERAGDPGHDHGHDLFRRCAGPQPH